MILRFWRFLWNIPEGRMFRFSRKSLWANLTVASGHGAVCEIPVPDAKLWDAEHPNLYTVRVSLMRKDKVIDVQEQRFGIRKIQWDASCGLKINGQVVKLRGACIHHDNGIRPCGI